MSRDEESDSVKMFTLWARKDRQFDEKVRQPFLRGLRRLLLVPQPRISYEEAVEIAYAFYGQRFASGRDVRGTPIFVRSYLRFYHVEIATWNFGGHDYWKISMADGHVYDFYIDPM